MNSDEQAVVRARVDVHLKRQAHEIFETLGISTSAAIRMFLRQVVARKSLPLELKVPNAVTLEAIEASRRGETESFASVDDLFADLNAEGTP